VSAGIGTGLSLLMLRSGSPVLRALAVVTGAALLARAVAGHCAVKAAITGQSTLGNGLREQWKRMSRSQPAIMDAEEAVEEQADPSALEEGFAREGASASSSSAPQH
jgi:hypothetical protein